MRIAVPVANEQLKLFQNAGHAPFFAVYEMVGGGAFRSFKLVELRANPRANSEHEDDCEDHTTGRCHHDGDPEEHKNDHRVMAEIVKDCSLLAVDRACKNTKLVFEEAGISVKAFSGCTTTDAVLKEVSKLL